MTFEDWKAKVNDIVLEISALHPDDLPDEDYWTHWSEDTPPYEMAYNVLSNNGYSHLIDDIYVR